MGNYAQGLGTTNNTTRRRHQVNLKKIKYNQRNYMQKFNKNGQQTIMNKVLMIVSDKSAEIYI